MKKIRRGNDFVFAWEIERNGLSEDLSSVLEKHLYLSVLGKRVELVEGVDYDITGNVVRIEITPTIANILGTYKAEFHYILPDLTLIDEDRKCAVDVDAFAIVGSTAQADDPSEFTVTSDMAIAFKGDKGDSFTYADFTPEQIAELKQPAMDAAQQAERLLIGDLAVAEREVNRYGFDLTQNQFDALVSFVFNVGAGNFRSSTLLKRLKANPNDPDIANQFKRWVYGGGKVLPGLVRRRDEETKLYFA